MSRRLKIATFVGAACIVGAAGAVIAGHTSTAKSMAEAPKTEQSSVHGLPGGASSLNETYQDWRVACQQAQSGGQCAVVQQEFNGQTHQLVMAVGLSPMADHIAGSIIAPLGVALAKGVTLQADGKTVGSHLSFDACRPNGCIAPVSLTQGQLASLENAQKIDVKLGTTDGHDIVLPLSNKGLSAAMTRVNALMH